MDATQERSARRNGEASLALILEVKLTTLQVNTLLAEFSAQRDRGTLAFTLAERSLVGDAATLAHVTYHLENSASVAEAVSGRAAHAKKLRTILRRIEKAGITASAPEFVGQAERRGAGEPSVIHAAPEARLDVAPSKTLHPSTQRKIERRREMDADDLWEAGIADWTILRRGRAQGRDLGKRAWNAKQDKRASGGEMVRGDKMFRRGLPDHLPIGKLNDERVEWIRAGAEHEDQKRSRAKSKDATFNIARAGCAEKLEKRILRMLGVTLAKHGRTRPSWIADELVREDVRARRYKSGSGKASYMRKRYQEAARKRIDPEAPRLTKPIETLSARAQKAAARQTKNRIVRIAQCEHSWRVTPKRTKRVCESCGVVERKQRGRWTRVTPKPIVEVFAPAVHTPEPKPYTMKVRTSRATKRNERRWIMG